MKLLKRIKHLKFLILYYKWKYGDPYYNCPLFNEEGCVHVDGLLCDYPFCQMMKKYKKNKNNEKG